MERNGQAQMTRSIAIVSIVLFLFGFVGPASAALIRTSVDSTFVVVDDVNNFQWADVNRFVDMNYSEVTAEIAAMNTAVFAGAASWRLADRTEMELLFAQLVTIGDAREFDPVVSTSIGGVINDIVVGRYFETWAIGNDSGNTRSADWRFAQTELDSSTSFDRKILPGTSYEDNFSFVNVGAFVVATATQVPEPSSLALLLIGGLGSWSFRRRLY